MKDFQYSNLNVPKMNEFLKKDTKNYKDLKGSLCGKAYNLEEKISQGNVELDVINSQIEAENENYERKINEIKNGKENEKVGFFSKLGKKLKSSNELKDLEKKHIQKISVLQDKLKKQSKIIEEYRMRLQAIIYKLEENGIIWEEMRKYLEERIRLGVFANQNSDDKSKIKKPDMKDYEKINWEEMRRRAKKEAIAEMSGSYEKNERKHTLNDKDKLDLSKLTPYEREQILKMYRHMKYNDGLSFDHVAARGFRLSLFDDNRLDRMARASNHFSDYSLYKNLYNPLFGNGGRGLRDLRNIIEGEKRGPMLSPNPNAPKTLLGWIDNTVKNIMKDSGYGLNYIKNNIKQTSDIFKDTFVNKFDSLERAGNFTHSYCDYFNVKDRLDGRGVEIYGKPDFLDKFSKERGFDFQGGFDKHRGSGEFDFQSNKILGFDRGELNVKGFNEFSSSIFDKYQSDSKPTFEGFQFDKSQLGGGQPTFEGFQFDKSQGGTQPTGFQFDKSQLGGGQPTFEGFQFDKSQLGGGQPTFEDFKFDKSQGEMPSFGGTAPLQGDFQNLKDFNKGEMNFGDNLKFMEDKIKSLEDTFTRSVLKDGMERGREIEKMETSALEQQRELTLEKSGPK